MKCLFKRIFIVEGNIAAGKSTLLNLIESNFKDVLVVQEPISKWKDIDGKNLLKLFYTEPQRWAFTFEFYSMFTKIITLKNALLSDADIIVVERSIFSDKIFQSLSEFYGKCNKLETAIFNEVYEEFLKSYTGINGVIYVDTAPDLCLERIRRRGREEETQISLDYLKKLGGKLFTIIYDAPIIMINGSYDLKKPQDVLKRVKQFFDAKETQSHIYI